MRGVKFRDPKHCRGAVGFEVRRRGAIRVLVAIAMRGLERGWRLERVLVVGVEVSTILRYHYTTQTGPKFIRMLALVTLRRVGMCMCSSPTLSTVASAGRSCPAAVATDLTSAISEPSLTADERCAVTALNVSVGLWLIVSFSILILGRVGLGSGMGVGG